MKLLKFPHTAYLVEKAAVTIFDGTITATPTLTAWPAGITGRCKVTLSSFTGHTDCAGSITVGSETLTFTQAGTKLTTTNLTSLPSVSSSGLDCHCRIAVIDSGGAEISAETLTTIKIRFEPTSKSFVDASGSWTQSTAFAMVQNSSIELNDIIRYNSINYPVKQIEAFNWLDGNELYRVLYF